MNKENVQVSIRAVKERKQFNMYRWFCVSDTDSDPVMKIGCGTAACIGGCTALTPEWKEQGGTIDQISEFCPVFNKEVAYSALAEFWEVEEADASNICTDPEFYGVDSLEEVTRDMALNALNFLLVHRTTHQYEPQTSLLITKAERQ